LPPEPPSFGRDFFVDGSDSIDRSLPGRVHCPRAPAYHHSPGVGGVRHSTVSCHSGCCPSPQVLGTTFGGCWSSPSIPHPMACRSAPGPQALAPPSPPLRCPSERCSNLVSNEPKPGARLGSSVASRRHCHRQTVRECLAQHEPLSSGSMFLASFRVGTKIVSCGTAFAVVTVLLLRLVVKPTCACQLRSWSRHRRYPPTHWIRRSCRLPRSRPTIDLRTVLDQRPAAGWL
jgi:hypothetical protein